MGTSTIELIAALGSIIAGYYILTVAIVDNLNFFTFNPNDYTRLKYDLYSHEKHRKNTFYIALALTIITNLILFIKTEDFEEAYLWTIVIMTVFTVIVICKARKLDERVLTINVEGITWYLHLRIDDKYLFSTEDNSKELDGEFKVQLLSKEEMLTRKPRYVERKRLSPKKKTKKCGCKDTLEFTGDNQNFILERFINKIDVDLTKIRVKAKAVGEKKEEEYMNELLQPILDEAVAKIKNITIENSDDLK